MDSLFYLRTLVLRPMVKQIMNHMAAKSKLASLKQQKHLEPTNEKKLTNGQLTFIYTTRLENCPYLDNRLERKIVIKLSDETCNHSYDHLVKAGFRRSGFGAYQQSCPNCSACIPTRICVKDFYPSKSMRRITRINIDLTTTLLPNCATNEHFELFKQYQEQRHSDGEMADMNFLDYCALVEESPLSTSIVEFRTDDQTLVGVCLFDTLSDSISAVYTFFHPSQKRRSLGIYMIIWLINHCSTSKKEYLYLGFWINQISKMDYKKRFKPIQILENNQWRNTD